MNPTSNLKQNLKKSAKTLMDEPLEILKNAKRQVSLEDYPQQQEQGINPEDRKQESGPSEQEQQYKKQKAESEGRTLQALENELKDIRRQRLFNSLMERIQNGESVPLEEFSDLSYEQKDVLKAQMEAVKKQKERANSTNSTALIEPSAKKGRQLFGQKKSAQKQTTRVEKPVPPSG